MVLVGGMRVAINGDIYADFPFEITFNIYYLKFD